MKGMATTGGRLAFCTMLGVGMLLSGCVSSYQFFQYNRDMDSDEMKQHISSLEQATAADNSDKASSSTYLALALLYAHRDNPQPDYDRALQMLERSISLDPNVARNNNVQSFRSLLGEIKSSKEECLALKDGYNQLTEKYAGLQRNSDLLKENVIDLTLNNKQLAKEKELLVGKNQELQDIIEQLKLLDIRLEEKRKNF
ncbi:MAG: hypothetical protein KQH63_09870 [Desulfobulbaceae bacterium]|nr:hypothetical protein [Desulfobulbaceae bacterium]